MRSGRHPVLVLAALLLAGCNTLGPPSVRRAPFEYNHALAEARNEQLLLNLVRLKYRDTPYFLEPTSLSTQYELSGGANAGLVAVEGGDGEASAGTGFSITERPTVTWTPLHGEDFVRQFLSPIPLETVLLLPEAGWSIERVLRLTVQMLNGVPNAPSASGPTPTFDPVFAEFQGLACTLRQLQVQGRLKLVVRETGTADGQPEAEYRLLLRPGPWRPGVAEEVCGAPGAPLDEDARAGTRTLPDPSVWPAGGLVLRNAYLAEEGTEKDELAIETRSLLEVMYYLSQGVDSPRGHGRPGKGLVTFAGGCDADRSSDGSPWRELTRNLFHVECSEGRPPEDAFVKVRHRGTWFYIRNDDLDSKSTFGLLMQLYSLQSGDAKGITPALTLDLGG